MLGKRPELATVVEGWPSTPVYTAPELLAGNVEQIGPETDIYSIGVILYELLTGQLPFMGRDRTLTPEEVKRRLPLTERAAQTVFKARETVRAILERRDPRLFVVVGPCSIHDVVAARDYATRLKALADKVEATLLPIMRVYFEKPRTTVGWKGLINDPDLDDSFHIEKGILMARELLLFVAQINGSML